MNRFQTWRIALIAGVLLGTSLSSRADDPSETDPNHVAIDLATYAGNRQTIRASVGTVRVTLKGVVDQRTTSGRVLADESPYGSGNARVQPFAENIHTYARQTLKSFRDQLQIGTGTPLREVYYDLRNPKANSRTQILYDDAKRLVQRSGKGPTAFFHEWGDRILCDMVFEIPAKAEAPQTKLVAPCYRESDLKNLMDLLVTAARLYIKTVDQVRDEVVQERALQQAAAVAP